MLGRLALSLRHDMSTWDSRRQQRHFNFNFSKLLLTCASSLLRSENQWLVKVTPLLPWLYVISRPGRVVCHAIPARAASANGIMSDNALQHFLVFSGSCSGVSATILPAQLAWS